MRKTSVLLRQHIGWHFAKHWRAQGKRKPMETGAEKSLKKKGIPISNPEDILRPKRVVERVEVVGYKDVPLKLDNSHPDWHKQPLLTYKDNNVLLEGLKQAKILTNSVELKEGLPESIVLKNDLENDINNRVKNIILGSYVFDAEQKKLPKIKDPERPAWNFPRSYGITRARANKLITSRLLQLIESTTHQELVKDRYIFNDLFFSLPFEKQGELLQFQLIGDTVLTSSKPLSPITKESTEGTELPDITPINPLITLNKENIYQIRNIYPIRSHTKKIHPHSIFIYYNKEEVKNLFEEEVTETQIFGRSLLKSFTVAASYAKKIYGNDVKLLPEPITVQCIHSDGQFYHFGVFQLNTLDLDENVTRNVWYQTPIFNLFNKCCYELGKPVLDGYDSKVIKHLYAFYNNV